MQGVRDYAKLHRRMVATTLGFSLLPLIVLGLSMYALFSVSITTRVMDSLKTLAENRRDAIDLFLEERTAQLQTLAYTHSIAQLREAGCLGSLLDLVQARGKAFIDLGVIDRAGNHLAYVGPYDLHGLNYAYELWFREAVERGIYISDVFLGFRKTPHFVIAVVRYEEDGFWVLRATIDAGIFSALVKTARVGSGGDSFVLSSDGILQTPSRISGELLGRLRYLDLSAVSDLRTEELNIDGDRALFALARLKSKDWVLVIREDPREELLELLHARHLVLGLGALGLLVIVAGAILVSRHMIRQLLQADHEKEELNESLIQSARLASLGTLAASIAHEVNNPLAIIQERGGWMQDLLKEEDHGKCKNLNELMDSALSIESNVARARRITERLLNFSRRSRPTVDPVDMNHLVDETIEFVRKEANHRGIAISTELFGDLPRTWSDATQLQQVFLNILNNAVHAIEKEGQINIRTSFIAPEKVITVSIADNGCGIPNEIMNRIFQPFFTTKEAGRGTGLGLSISYTIMQALGGRILVASEVGKGTTFTVYVPVTQQDSSVH